MVTIGLSTISVVTSILIVRLSGVSRPLPAWVRLGIFRMVARAMCVQLQPSSKSAVAPQPQERDFRASSRSKLIADCDVISLDEGNNHQSNNSRDVSHKIDDVLSELRKVGISTRNGAGGPRRLKVLDENFEVKMYFFSFIYLKISSKPIRKGGNLSTEITKSRLMDRLSADLMGAYSSSQTRARFRGGVKTGR